MKRFAIALLLLFASSTLFAKDKPPIPNACLAVYPAGDACVRGVRGLGPDADPFVLRNCYSYLESTGLPMKEIKTSYGKGALEKLEARGVRVVVTTGNAHQGAACFASN